MGEVSKEDLELIVACREEGKKLTAQANEHKKMSIQLRKDAKQYSVRNLANKFEVDFYYLRSLLARS